WGPMFPVVGRRESVGAHIGWIGRHYSDGRAVRELEHLSLRRSAGAVTHTASAKPSNVPCRRWSGIGYGNLVPLERAPEVYPSAGGRFARCRRCVARGRRRQSQAATGATCRSHSGSPRAWGFLG